MPLTRSQISNNETGRPSKKQNLTHHHGFESIDDLTIDLIFSFLDIKTLHRITFTSKHLMTKLTHDHVVQSAVLTGGGHKYSTMYDIVNLIKKRRITVPSPLRLLRLMNGRTCERGSQCRHLKRGKSPKRVNTSRTGYGLFVCWQCLTTDLTTRVEINHPILVGDRVLRTGTDKYEAFIMKAPFYDLSGERAGAILSLKEYEDLKENDETFGIETLLKSNTNRWLDKSSDIILGFEKACVENKKRERERRQKSRKRKLEALDKKIKKHAEIRKRREGALTKKIKRVMNLKKMVHDHLPSDAPWKNYVLSSKDPNGLEVESPKSPCVVFMCPIVDEKMKPYVMAPYKGTKKAMKDIANKINQEMEMIHQKNFLDCSFLLNNNSDDDDDDDDDAFKSAVRAFFQEKYSIPRTLIFHENFNSVVLDLVKEDRLVEALKMRMEGCL